MSNIFTPIDSSNLIDLIPEGDDILYSTICKVKVFRSVGPRKTRKWESHVIITKSGFASFTFVERYTAEDGKPKYRVRKKKEGLIAVFTPWEEIHLPKGRKTITLYKNSINIMLSPIRFLIYKDKLSKSMGDFSRNLWRERTGN